VESDVRDAAVTEEELEEFVDARLLVRDIPDDEPSLLV